MLSRSDEDRLRRLYNKYEEAAQPSNFRSGREFERYRSDLLMAYNNARRYETYTDAAAYFRSRAGGTSIPSRSPSPEYGGIHSYQSVDPAAYLAQLSQQSNPGRPLADTITAVTGISISGGVNSGRGNQECVAAAIATTIGKSLNYVLQYERGMSSTDSGIVQLATAVGLRQLGISDIGRYFQSRRRVFVRADAMYGNGWHAYCAFDVSSDGRALYAWDPDYEEQNNRRGYKKIPLSLIDEDMIFG